MTTTPTPHSDIAAAILAGHTSLGIELGSTRIKACLISDDGTPLAEGSHSWENTYDNGLWTYPLPEVDAGMQAAYASLLADTTAQYGVAPTRFGAIGVSAMMHGYLAFDADDNLLVPFRTWRNTNTGPAAGELSELLGYNIPLRWSIAHWYQAILDNEEHVDKVARLTTLAGYVHWKLTGRHVLGVGDASGMFPIDPATRDYDQRLLDLTDTRIATHRSVPALRNLLPDVLVAGSDAGRLTAQGARWLDTSATLASGIPLCPPEGDAGTGMVATNAVSPRTGNVSAGTSIFAMVVLEQPLTQVHHELDLVTTPTGDLVAMVHCNNGASELNAWATLLGEFAQGLGVTTTPDAIFETFFTAALNGQPDGGGLLAYNYLSGEPITGLEQGRPLFVRTPDSRLTLANFARTHIYGAFGTLALGMRVLSNEGVVIDNMFAHGGMFRTAGVAQRFLAAAINAPVSVGTTAGEGGAWGIAVLAHYTAQRLSGATADDLGTYLTTHIFADSNVTTVEPQPSDVDGFATYLTTYETGLAIERAATTSL